LLLAHNSKYFFTLRDACPQNRQPGDFAARWLGSNRNPRTHDNTDYICNRQAFFLIRQRKQIRDATHVPFGIGQQVVERNFSRRQLFADATDMRCILSA